MRRTLFRQTVWDVFGACLPLVIGGLAVLLVRQPFSVVWGWVADGILMPPAVLMAFGLFRQLVQGTARIVLLGVTLTCAVAVFTIATLPDDTWGAQFVPDPDTLAWSSLALFLAVAAQCVLSVPRPEAARKDGDSK